MSLGSFAMWPAFPTSDYYDPSVPFRRHRPTTGLPADQLAAGRGGDRRDGSHVHREPLDGVGAQLCPCGLATSTPQTFDVASLPATFTGSEVPRTGVRVRTAAQPTSIRFELVVLA